MGNSIPDFQESYQMLTGFKNTKGDFCQMRILLQNLFFGILVYSCYGVFSCTACSRIT